MIGEWWIVPDKSNRVSNRLYRGSRPKAVLSMTFFADGEVIRLRLSPDYVPAGWSPLWPSSDYTDALVSQHLLAELISWQEEFSQNFHWEKGWRSKEAMDHWAAKATQLEVELRAELAGKAELEVDLWPLPRGEDSWKTTGW